MIRMLYVGNDVKKVTSGYEILNIRNLSLLKRLKDVECEIAEFQKYVFVDKLFFHVGGTSFNLVREVLDRCAAKKYDCVFFSSSLLGPVIKKVKQRYPDIKIICNFHNVERQYAAEFLKVSGVSHLPFFIASFIAEKLSIKYLDYSIVLNDRDAGYLRKLYNKRADLILPITVADKFDKSKVERNVKDIIYLFVGVAFYANVEGVRWFIKEILPYIQGKFIVVGKGMDAYRREFECDRVEVHGFVDDLSHYYYRASFVVSPILSGGGMKTKVAEALMYGKTVIGTKEALEGYYVEKGAIYQCDTSSHFVDVINTLTGMGMVEQYNPMSRQLYLDNYSNECAFEKLNSAIQQWK